MAKSERSKCLKHWEGIDRISSLPEVLLSHILSLLPTKYAVATSVLSKRWKFLWTSISNLHFDDEKALYTSYGEALAMKRNKFTQFVNRVLLLLNPPLIQNFHLECYVDFCDPFYLELWICTAILRTVQKLELHFSFVHFKPMELPSSHFYCKTLTVLKLKGRIHFNITASASICFSNLETLHLRQVTFTIASSCSVNFPSLKDLHLHFVRYANEESAHKLFASCPILDNLVINRSHCDDLLCLIISIPSLRRLQHSAYCANHPRTKTLQMDTPALKYLHLKDLDMCEYFTAENLSSLLEARLEFHFEQWLNYFDANSYSMNIFKFIGGLFNVKFLSISGDILKAISSISANIAPVFRNLTRLELGGHSCRGWSVVIKNWLESSDNLEHLVLEGSCTHCYCESLWTEPLRVPMCLLRRVTTISFTHMYVECRTELEVIRYFLKNAKVLQLLTVDTEKLKLRQKISMFPRGSQACQVAFT